MAGNKRTRLSGLKNTTEPVNERSKNPNEVLADILTAIRQLEPEQQNQVIAEMLKEIGLERSNTRQLCQIADVRACKNLDEYITFASNLEKTLSHLVEQKVKG